MLDGCDVYEYNCTRVSIRENVCTIVIIFLGIQLALLLLDSTSLVR